MEHVIANLGAERNILFGLLELGRSFEAFFKLKLIELRPQHIHRDRFILELRPLVLTGHDSSGREMRYAHGAVCNVDMLTACS